MRSATHNASSSDTKQRGDNHKGSMTMNIRRTSIGRPALWARAAVVAALCSGVLAVVGVTPPAEAFSSSPTWFTTGGTQVSSLTCGTWYYTTMGTQTGGGSAAITITGGGGGGGASSTGSLGNQANTGTGGAGGTVVGAFTVNAGQSIATYIGCGGGGGIEHSSGSTSTGGAAGTGYANGGAGGNSTNTNGQQSGGGGGGGATVVCDYGTATSPCASLLGITGGGGGGGGAGCTGNGGQGGNGNAGATTGTASNSENSTTSPQGGTVNGQGFGGGGGGADGASQAYGGGGGGGVGAPGQTSSTSPKSGSGGAANSTGGAGGGNSGAGGLVNGSAGSNPSSPSGAGAGATGPNASTSNTQHPGGGGGGGGYAGGGSGTSNSCTITPSLGGGGGGAGSSWVSTSNLTSFTNGSNPTFTAGSTVNSSACGQHQAIGTSGATTGAGGEGFPSSSGTGGGYAGCPGNVILTWTALPGAPTGVSCTGGNAQVSCSWTAPTDPGTSSITSYKLTAVPVPSGTTVTHTFSSTATTETLTGLTNGISYNLSVAAITSVGTGPAANASNNPISLGTAPAITSANSTTFTVGSAGTFTVTSSGSPTPALSEVGSLPSGVSFSDNGNGTATLSGTPAGGTGGSYPITITAANGISPNATQNFTLTVDQAPAITSASTTTFAEGSAGTFTVTSTGFPTNALSEVGSLPNGVSFVDNGNGTATLSGTPAGGTGGSYPITITAANGVSPNATQNFTLTVQSAPAITSAGSTTFTVGSAGTFTVTSTGFPTNALSEVGSLPSGVSFVDNGDGTATLSGTPAAGSGGSYPITITASNGVSPNATQNFALTVDEAPAITSDASTTFTVGSAGTFTVTSTGFPTAALSEVGSLPSGVTFVDNGDGTATLSGTPAAGTGGSYAITITATNGVSPDANQSFTLTVDEAPAITSDASTTFTEGSSGTFTVTSTGFPTAALSEVGSLPNGVSFVDNGDGTATLSGTPAVGSNGVYSFSITATNGVSPDATQTFTLTVQSAPAITSADSTTFVEGSAGTFTVTSTGFPTAALSEVGSLPSGVTFADNGDGKATLAGTPGAGTGGSYAITITATNGVSPDANQSFTLTVDEAPAITSDAGTTFTEGSSGTFTVTSTGFPTAALSENGSLPNGVTFADNGDGTATLAGTPAAGTGGSYAITITATNGVSPDANQSFTLTVDEAPAITSDAGTTFTEGSSGTFTVTSTGFPTAALSENGSLPNGVTFADNGDGTATLAGTPAAGTGGSYAISITATNGISPDGTQTFTLTVQSAPAITSDASTTFTEGSAGTFTVTSTGFPTAALSEVGSLPSGVTFADNGDGTATLAGTPAAGTGGSYGITITASNGVSPDANQSFTLTVDEAPAITSDAGTTFTEGSSGTFTVTSTGFPTPALSEFGSLPNGVSFVDNGDGTATLSGTPAAGSNGMYSFSITATNGVSPDATQTFTLTVDAAPAITSADSTTFVEGSAGTFTVTSTGFPTAALSEVGLLPSGVSFVDNGDGTATLSGTPAVGSNGVYPITFKASNGVHPNATQSFTLTVDAAPVFTSPTSTTFTEGSPGSFTPTASGRPTPTITEFGNLPNGVTFSGGVLSGTPTQAGTFPILFTANNGVGGPVTQNFTLTVNGPLTITTTALPSGTKGVAYSYTVQASGGTAPYKWKIKGTTPLPPGLSINSSTGVISGTPTKAGTFTVLVKVKDSTTPTKEKAKRSFTIVIGR